MPYQHDHSQPASGEKASCSRENGTPFSSRLEKISPFLVMEVLEEAQRMEARGESVIHMEVGEPGGESPPEVKTAAWEAIQKGDTRYTNSMGKPELREEISRYYRRVYGLAVSPEQIIVTSGSSPAMLLAFSALLEPGDEVLLADPYYACYPNFIRYLGGKPVYVPAAEENGFKMSVADIKKRITPRTRAILINSPANPTGAVLTAQELEEIASLGCLVVSDEVYHGMNYLGRDHTVLEFTDRAIVINGFSKRHVMTGWRLGYIIAPPMLIRGLQKMQQNLFISACAFIQAAAIAALREDDKVLERRIQAYRERNRYLFEQLREIGIAPAQPPSGAFYMLANVKKYTSDSLAMAFDILRKAKVAVAPGIDFGPGAEGYLRISYACSMEELQEGMRRLADYFASLKH